MIHCIGNSHINTFSGEPELNYKNVQNDYFKGYWIGPTIAYNIFDHHFKNAMNHVREISNFDYITLIVGEVDCRLHLPQQGTTFLCV